MNTRTTVDFARVIVIYKIIEIRHQSLVNSNHFSFPWGVRVCGGFPCTFKHNWTDNSTHIVKQE